MRKILSLVLTSTFLISLATSAGLATAAPAGSPRTLAAAMQEVGDSIVINDVDGNEAGTATVDDLVDPFEDVEESITRGQRAISVELTVENTGENVLTVNPQDFALVDDSGIIWVDVELTRSDRVDELEATDLEPGDSVSGGLEIIIPDDSEIGRIMWIAGQGQLANLVTLVDPVDLGDPVSLVNVDYEEEALVTAEDVVDEFDDLARGAEPLAGNKFVGVTITIENTGEEPITPDPTRLFIGTSDGIFWAPFLDMERSDDAIDETPALTDDPIDPGDSVTGFVGFSVTEDLDISYVMYFPDGARLIHLYDAGTGSSRDSDADEDADTDDGGLGPIGKKKTPTPADDDRDTGEDTGSNDTGDECAGAVAWQDVTIDTLGQWGGFFSDLDLQNPGPNVLDEIRDGADLIRDLADQQAESDPPPAAEDLNDLIVQAYEDSAQALDDLADAVEANDDDAFADALTTIQDIGNSFTTGEVADVLAELQSDCPEIDQL